MRKVDLYYTGKTKEGKNISDNLGLVIKTRKRIMIFMVKAMYRLLNTGLKIQGKTVSLAIGITVPYVKKASK